MGTSHQLPRNCWVPVPPLEPACPGRFSVAPLTPLPVPPSHSPPFIVSFLPPAYFQAGSNVHNSTEWTCPCSLLRGQSPFDVHLQILPQWSDLADFTRVYRVAISWLCSFLSYSSSGVMLYVASSFLQDNSLMLSYRVCCPLLFNVYGKRGG